MIDLAMYPIQQEFSIEAPAPAVRFSDTSVAAAEAIEPHLNRLEQLVMAAFVLPATCDEVEIATGLSHQTVSARIRRLAQIGQLVDSGERRRTRSGRQATVWTAP